MSTTPRVFVAYSRQDREHVLHLDAGLRKRGFDPLWDKDLLVGEGFPDGIRCFIAHAHVFIPLVTRTSVDRPWVQNEAGFADALNVPVLPLCLGATPKGLLSQVQGRPWPADPTEEDLDDLARQLRQRIERAARGSRALYEVAPRILERARALADYATRVSDLDRGGVLRQEALAGSFSIPDEVETHELWSLRGDETPRDPEGRRTLREERRALELHARRHGYRLLLDVEGLRRKFDAPAVEARVRVLRDFLAAPVAGTAVVGLAPLDDGPDEPGKVRAVTAVGDWFTAHSVRVTAAGGWEQTVFTRHTPTIRRQIERFDEELDLVVARQPGGAEGSREYVLGALDAFLDGRRPPRIPGPG